MDMTGLIKLFEKNQREAVIILMYHRVLPSHQKMLIPMHRMIMEKDLFEQQMEYIVDNFNVISLETACNHLKNKTFSYKRSIVVTIDDGYRDTYTYAYLILKKYNIPATVFITTGMVDENREFWWDRISNILLSCSKNRRLREFESITCKWPGFIRKCLNRLEGSDASSILHTDMIIRHLVRLGKVSRNGILQDIEIIAERSGYVPEVPRSVLSWREIKELNANGISIGSHSITHDFLDEISETVARREIEESMERIFQMTGESPCTFAFPGGRMNRNILGIVKNAGFRGAVTTNPGLNFGGCDLYQLKRIDAGYFNVQQVFSKSVMRFELINGLRSYIQGSSSND